MRELLTAKLEVGSPADDGAASVEGQALVGASVVVMLRATDHQVTSHQCVARVSAEHHLSAIHPPPGK